MIIKTLNKLILNMYHLSITFIVDNLFSLIIKQFQKVISIPLFLQIYNFIISFYDFLLILFFFFLIFYILLTIIFMHYIFLISFGTSKIFKF